jgi:hypothetical protein
VLVIGPPPGRAGGLHRCCGVVGLAAAEHRQRHQPVVLRRLEVASLPAFDAVGLVTEAEFAQLVQ